MKCIKVRHFSKFLFIIFCATFVWGVAYNLSKLAVNHYILQEPIIYKNSYIRQIHAPFLGEEFVKKTLDNFNKMGYDKIVFKKGLRPIDIYETGNIISITKNRKTLALSTDRITSCGIELNVGAMESTEQARQVILHEYLHCMGYGHINYKDDLMHELYNNTSEENIKAYAEDLYKRLHDGKR